MVKAFVNIGIPKQLAKVMDDLVQQTNLGFTSRGELMRRLLQEYLEKLVHDKIVPPEMLRKIE